MEKNNTFNAENDALLEMILERKYYKALVEKDGKANVTTDNVELNITATCNQKCEYCYLVKHGDKIYPAEIRDEKTIVKNARLVLNYLTEKNMYIRTISLFSGEIWGTKLADSIFKELIQAYKNGLRFDTVLIPSNMSFLLKENFKKNIESWIEKFDKLNIRLQFSASVDGLCIEETERSFIDESRNAERTELFYDTLFKWCRQYNYNYHPMVAAGSIEKWPENYDWWMKMFAKYDENPWLKGMYLEVRNDEWTTDKIRGYLKFLNHMIDYDFGEMCFGDARLFAKAVFSKMPEVDEKRVIATSYRGYLVQPACRTPGCTIDKDLIIRLGDLAIGPCHRTHYEQFIYGRYKTEGTGEDERIVGVTANNAQLANLFYNNTDKCYMRCSSCPIEEFCLKQCFGAQYETSGEILLPINSVCELFKARVVFLALKYSKIFKASRLDSKQLDALNKLNESANELQRGGFQLCEYLDQQLRETIS